VWQQGKRLQDGYRELAKVFRMEAITDCAGLPPWTVITFKDHGPWSSLELHTLFQQEMIRRRILFSGSQFISLAHGNGEIETTLQAYRESFKVLRRALDENCVTGLILDQVNQPVLQRRR